MAEELDLTTPVVESKTTDIYSVVMIMMNSDEPIISGPLAQPPGMVQINIKDNNGLITSQSFSGTLAQDMIRFINTADFTTRSLEKRILEKLNAMGVLVGTVTGTPEVPSGPTGLE